MGYGNPSMLCVVRHGQSAGNVARDAAEAQGLHLIDIATRDIDVPLSDLGKLQSESLGDWFGSLPEQERPEVVIASPYVRAGETARIILNRLKNPAIRLRMDERLREKEFGVLDRLTPLGIKNRFPDLDQQRSHVGKFYFRPPGGESWCDVILRLRSMLEMMAREYEGKRVLVVAHQVTVNCMRYLIEQMDEQTILDIDRMGDVPNCGVTTYTAAVDDQDRRYLKLKAANFVAPLLEAGTPVTSQPDAAVAAKP